MNSLLNVNEISEFLSLHPKTVYRLAKQNKIPHIRRQGLGLRFSIEKVEAWLGEASFKQHTLTPFPSLSERLDIPAEEYDRLYLKGENALSKKNSKRWNYGFGAVFTKTTSQGITRWYIDYKDESGTRIQKVVKHAQSKEDAVIELQARVQEVFARRNGIRRRVERIRLCKYSELYLRDYSRTNKRSWKTDKSLLKSLVAFFGDFYLDEITSQHIELYKARRLTQDVTRSTVNRELAILRKMLNLAVEWGYLEKGQGVRFRLFSEKGNFKERILSEEEEKRLFEASSGHLRPVLVIALQTGMRLGEILSLRWDQIDLEERVIRVERTKSGRVRFVPVNDQVLEELLRLRKERSEEEDIFPWRSVKTSFKGACRRAGIKDLRFHDLRHTFATRLVKRGIDLITVKELLGHSSVTVTERYTHSFKDEKKRAVSVLSESARIYSEIRPQMLNICEMKKEEKEKDPVTPFFSVN